MGGNGTPAVSVVGDSMSLLQSAVHDWANETFPGRVPANAWLKLFEELGETIKNPEDPLEWGDVMIMLMDLAKMHGVDLYSATFAKLEINRSRVWDQMPSGVFQHVEPTVIVPGGCAPPVMVHAVLPSFGSRPPTDGYPKDRSVFKGGPYDGVEMLGRINAPGAQLDYRGVVAHWFPEPDGYGGCYVVDHVYRHSVSSGGTRYIHYKWNENGVPF